MSYRKWSILGIVRECRLRDLHQIGLTVISAKPLGRIQGKTVGELEKKGYSFTIRMGGMGDFLCVQK